MRNGKGVGGGGEGGGFHPPLIPLEITIIVKFSSSTTPHRGQCPAIAHKDHKPLDYSPPDQYQLVKSLMRSSIYMAGNCPDGELSRYKCFHSWRKSNSVVFVRQKKEETWDKLGNSGIIGRFSRSILTLIRLWGGGGHDGSPQHFAQSTTEISRGGHHGPPPPSLSSLQNSPVFLELSRKHQEMDDNAF